MSRQSRAVAVLLVLSFGLLAGFYSMITPMWEAPDEIAHFGFVETLLKTRRLPEQQAGKLSQAHQPPLYYVIASIFAAPADIDEPTGPYRPNPDFAFTGGEDNISLHHTDETFPYRGQALALHLARLSSVLMGMVTVALTIAMGWRIYGDRPWIGLLAGALVAFNPQYLFISSAVNNDALLAMTTTGILWQATRMLTGKGRLGHWLVLGLWISAALLTKASSFVVAGVALLFVALDYLWLRPRPRNRKLLLQGTLLAAGIVILLSGWWFARNQYLYGDPLGWGAYSEIYDMNLRDAPLTWSDLKQYVTVQFRSFWGVFGWMKIRAPQWFYTTVIVMMVISAAGYVISFAVDRFRELRGASGLALPMMAAAVVVQELYQTWAITINNDSWYQGRYLFPVIAPISLLVAIGLVTVICSVQRRSRILPDRSHVIALVGFTIVLAGIALFMAVGVIAPAFERPALPKTSLWFVPNRTDVTYGDMIRLRGYDIEAGQDSNLLNLTFYWQAIKNPDFNYSAFVHLIDSQGRLLTQDDRPPGEDQDFPPPAWLPKDIVRDRRVIALPANAEEPVFVHVGLYNWANGVRLPAHSTGEIKNDAFVFSLGGR